MFNQSGYCWPGRPARTASSWTAAPRHHRPRPGDCGRRCGMGGGVQRGAQPDLLAERCHAGDDVGAAAGLRARGLHAGAHHMIPDGQHPHDSESCISYFTNEAVVVVCVLSLANSDDRPHSRGARTKRRIGRTQRRGRRSRARPTRSQPTRCHLAGRSIGATSSIGRTGAAPLANRRGSDRFQWNNGFRLKRHPIIDCTSHSVKPLDMFTFLRMNFQ